MNQKWNQHQEKVVLHKNGPLLVISGAGTGKTHVLTGRILYLILGETKGFPHELGLSPREVRDTRPPSFFSTRLGPTRPKLVLRESQTSVLPSQILALTFTEKSAEEMAGRINDALPIGHEEVWVKTFHGFCDAVLRERGHEIGLPLDYKMVSGPDLSLFLKRHVAELPLKLYRPLASPQKFLSALQEYFSRLKDEDITPSKYDSWVTAESKKAESEEEKEYAARHMELSKIYAAYENLLIQNGLMDFGGLIASVLRLFTERPSVLAEYQKRFRYILVDEFQDTNFSQNRMITLLAGIHRNLLVVGDDDQSIYKWRGASLTNIQYFKKIFPEASAVVLNENYRSDQAILDAAYAVIQKNNPHRLEVTENIDKRLRSISKKAGNMPAVRHFAEVEDEVSWIIESASLSLKRERNPAVLVRTNALAQGFIALLERKHLPFQHFAPGSLFAKPAVKDSIAVLRMIANPWDEMAAFRCLRLPCFGIPMEKISEALRAARDQNIRLLDALENRNTKLFLELLEFSRLQPVSAVLQKFIQASGYLEYAGEHPEILEDLALFSERVKDFEARHSEKTVADFLQYVSLIEEGGDSMQEIPLLDPHAIKILTIHGAKGLEFDDVFVPGMVSGKFPLPNRHEPFQIPEALIPEPLPEGNHHMEEERRLFYVAATRARENLFFTYSDFYGGKKQWKVSPFISELLESGKSILATPRTKGTIKKQSELRFEAKAPEKLTLNLPKLSFSQLDTFQTCPLKYQFRYLLKIPAPLPSQVHFGQSIHQTLKDFYEYLQENPEKSATNVEPKLLEFYEKNWIPRGYDSAALQEDQKQAGREMLRRFYKKEKLDFRVPAFLEKPFKLDLGKVVITGRIDRIDRLADGTYEVIDYKTGTPSDKNLKRDLQLSIYALACRDVLKIPVSRLSLYYLENLEKNSTARTEKELEACEREILECASELTASDFSPTPGFHCRYCEFRLLCPVASLVSTGV